ncbi:hypothetical protein [Plantactinospora sp. B5E13]|uniref:hypothetical protein n=1 Tax=unclassified Plantactinospora TaxID=2631981 RepID=UPI00325D1C4D
MTDSSIPFNYYLLEKNLTEVGTYLTELRYIDQVFAYMNSEASGLWDIVFDGMSSAFSSGGHSITVEFGGTVPFRRSWVLPAAEFGLPFQDSRPDEAKQQIAKYEVEAREWAGSNIATVRSMVASIAHPAGSVYSADMIGPVKDALHELEDRIPDDFGKLTYSLGDWEGDAAREFVTNFYHPFQHTLDSHRRMLNAFAGSLASAHAIVEATQQSLMNVVHHTREALLEQLKLRAEQAKAASDKSVKTALVLIEAPLPILATKGRWEQGLGAVDAGSALAGTALEEHALTGSTAEELLLALTKAITLIETRTDQQYVRLNQEVQNVLARMESIRHMPDGADGRLVPPRPRLVDGVDSGDFYMPSVR